MRVTVKTDDIDGFFGRARAAARRADKEESFDSPVMTFSFGDTDRMFAVLSETRRRLMHEIMQTPKSLQEWLEQECQQGFEPGASQSAVPPAPTFRCLERTLCNTAFEM